MSQKMTALLVACLLAASPAMAESKEDKRLLACREVLQEFLEMKEATIPRSLIDRAKCLAVVPSVKKFALGVGGRWGKGADASVAAGPVGRTGEAGTDLRMQAEILSYSRTRGLFAGVALEGAVVKQDKDGNRSVYGEDVSPRELLFLWVHPVPDAARGFVGLLNTISPRPAE